MNHKKLKAIILLSLFSFLILAAGPVFALPNFAEQNLGGLALEINYPRIPGAQAPQDFSGTAPAEEIPSLYAKYIFNLALWLTGLIAFGFLVYGGILYLISTGKAEAIAAAKDHILAAFIGILILLSSFIVFKVINPQLLILSLQKLPEARIIERPDIEPPPGKKTETSIDPEMPFGRIIEAKIFETYVSTGEQREPRMTRVKNNAQTTLDLAEDLKEQNENLKEATYKCGCDQAEPCCRHPNPGPGCTDNMCVSKPGCTCDPCKKVRGEIEKIEKENLDKMEKLKEEQKKSEKEIEEIRTELNRLARARKFIEECPWQRLNSLARFLVMADYFDVQKWIIREFRFWSDIPIVYFSQKGRQLIDWATFYCDVSGTIEEEHPYAEEPPEESISGEESEEEAEEFSEKLACATEAPVGEIIDRTLRLGNLLVKRLEKLIKLNKELVEAVDEMHVLVSQCSSQRCLSKCKLTEFGCIKECIKDENRYPEGPCPLYKIIKQAQKIGEIVEGKKNPQTNAKEEEGIRDVVKASAPEEKEEKEKIGIITIIDEIVPKILEDLENEVRYPMERCSIKRFEERDILLLNCVEAMRGTDPQGDIIRVCCEEWDKQGNKQTPFGDCLDECYLEEGQKKYRECLQQCLNRKSQEINEEELSWCRHHLNFYCCHIQ